MTHPTPTSPAPDHPESRLLALGYTLPKPAVPVAAYVPTRRVGNTLFVSGQIPSIEGKFIASGAVPSSVSLETAQQCARQCTLNGLAAAKAALGDLATIRSVIRIGCFVACEASFIDHPKVANGASELLVAIFGDAGRHARAAVGAPSLPLGAPVEIEFLFEVE